MKGFPKISIVIFAKNEEQNIKLCLESVYSQNYPKNKLEVVFVDDVSTDATAKIAKSYPVRYFKRDSHGDRDANKLYGFKKATGEIVTYLDADIHVRKGWLMKMVKPLVENKNITASFTRYYTDEHSQPIERYLNLDPLQRDVVYQYFSPSPESVVTETKKGYKICMFTMDKIPPQGVCFHRRHLIEHRLKDKRFLELDILVDLTMSGHRKFAYVPSAGMHHHHAKSLSELLKKRMRNISDVYLVENEKRLYKWFSLKSFGGIIKVLIWCILAFSVFPLVITGLYKSLKNKKFIGMYEPIVGLMATIVIVYTFISDVRTSGLFK